MSAPITERDLKILTTIDEYGFLTTKQIRELFFPDTHRSLVYRRLKILHRRKLLKYNATTLGGGYLWRLTSKSAGAIGSSQIFKTINHNTVFHDVLVNDIRLAFERLGIGSNWISSHKIFRQSGRISPRNTDNIPDWLFTFPGVKKPYTCAIEVEISQKSKKRIYETVRHYNSHRGADFVWYFVYTKSLGRLFQQVLRDFYGRSECPDWLHFIKIHDFLKAPLESTLHTMDEPMVLKSIVNDEVLEKLDQKNLTQEPADKCETGSACMKQGEIL